MKRKHEELNIIYGKESEKLIITGPVVPLTFGDVVCSE